MLFIRPSYFGVPPLVMDARCAVPMGRWVGGTGLLLPGNGQCLQPDENGQL